VAHLLCVQVSLKRMPMTTWTTGRTINFRQVDRWGHPQLNLLTLSFLHTFCACRFWLLRRIPLLLTSLKKRNDESQETKCELEYAVETITICFWSQGGRIIVTGNAFPCLFLTLVFHLRLCPGELFRTKKSRSKIGIKFLTLATN
jgi:hypothetical protein